MAKKKVGPGVVSLGALLLAATGCSGGDASAGSEGNAINLGRCYGANCGEQVQAVKVEDVPAASCVDVGAELEEPLSFEVIDGARPAGIRIAPDGTVWVLERSDGMPPSGGASLSLAHFSIDGVLLGTTGVVTSESDHVWTEQDLAVDAAGVATVAVYTNFAETADSEVIEELKLFSFDAELQSMGAPLVFHGVAVPKLAGADAGTYWLAGNAVGNKSHGVVSRVEGREPVWIQTGVPTSGNGAGVGVSGLAVASDGTSAILAQRSPRWSGGPDVYRYGIATYDAAGKPIWNMELPTEFVGGYRATLVGTPEGDLVVAGVTSEGSNVTIRSVSRTGQLGWAFQVQSLDADNLALDPETGRTFATTTQGLAVIEAEGQSCKLHGNPHAPGALSLFGMPRVRGDHVYASDGYLVWRYRLPTE